MKRGIIRVEPLSTYLENWKAPVEKFAAVNAIYAGYFPKDPPARILVCVPARPGAFDIEIDCVATR